MVRKVYRGPGAVDRCRRETAALSALAGRLPVPPVLTRDAADLPGGAGPAETGLPGPAEPGLPGAAEPGPPDPAEPGGDDGISLIMGRLPGVPGQDLIEAGRAGPVLAACGRMLRQVHAADPALVDPAARPGQVLVHGDYGPNNTLFSPDGAAVTGVVDWEWAHAGAAVEDLAWCEWIVRMHHPDEVGALGGFFASYGSRPSWAARQQVMTSRCQDMLELCQRWQPAGPAVARWRDRLRITASWTA